LVHSQSENELKKERLDAIEFDLIIFDLDGTLLDTVPDVHSSINITLKTMGLPLVTMAQAKKAIGPSRDIFARIILGEDNLSRTEEFFRIFRPTYEKNCYQKTRPFAGIMEVLEELKNIKLAVASNKMLSMTKIILQELELEHHFDIIVGPELVQHPKPAADMIDYSLQRLRVAYDRAILLGDTDNDILAARAAGVQSCFAGWGYAATKDALKRDSNFYAQTPGDFLTIFQKKTG